jgi:uncharacterized protein with HEPN domain
MQRDELLVEEMIDAAGRAMELVRGLTAEQVEADRDRREALLWNFTVLGEAAAQVSNETKAAHPGVGWRNPTRLRNRIVHGYWSIDFDVLHTTATDQLAPFMKNLESVLETLQMTAPDLEDRGELEP